MSPTPAKPPYPDPAEPVSRHLPARVAYEYPAPPPGWVFPPVVIPDFVPPPAPTAGGFDGTTWDGQTARAADCREKPGGGNG